MAARRRDQDGSPTVVGRLRRPGDQHRRSRRTPSSSPLPLRGRPIRAGEPRRGGQQGPAWLSTQPSSIWTSWWMTGSWTSSIAVLLDAGDRARDAPLSCTVARRGRWSVSVPERSYELAGRLLAQAVTDAEGEDIPISETLRRAARDEGHSLGATVLKGAGSKGRSAIRDATTQVLADCGYEPRGDSSGVTLVNCPFRLVGQGVHRPCLWDEPSISSTVCFLLSIAPDSKQCLTPPLDDVVYDC